MEQIKKCLWQLSDHNRKHYEYELSKMSEEKKQQLETFVVRLVKEGAKNPLSWAFSEVQEGIPQFARFMIIKNMYLCAYDVAGNVDAGEEFDQQTSNIHQEIVEKIGTEKLHQFLKSYAKGMLYNMVGVFDEGNLDYESDYSWQLMQYNPVTDTLGRPVSGLHEDFLEFDAEIEIGGKEEEE